MARPPTTARAIYQVHSAAESCIDPLELRDVVQRHALPFGHLQVEIVDAVAHEPRSLELIPRPTAFHPELSFDQYARIRQARWIYRIEAQEAEPEDLDYLRSGMLVAGELAALCGGTIFDTLARQVFDAEFVVQRLEQAFSPAHHLSIHVEPARRPYWVHTHGMAKFGHADFQLHGVPEESLLVARKLLNTLCAAVVAGGRFHPGEEVQLCGFSFEIDRDDPADREHFDGSALTLARFALLEAEASEVMAGMLSCAPNP